MLLLGQAGYLLSGTMRGEQVHEESEMHALMVRLLIQYLHNEKPRRGLLHAVAYNFIPRVY